MHEESLHRLREQQQEYEDENEEFAALSGVFTAGFQKFKKQTQEKLDRIAAEIIKTDDEIDAFIEKTQKDSENFIMVLEGKEAKQNVLQTSERIEALEAEVQKKAALVTDLEQSVREKAQRIEAVEFQVQEKQDFKKKFSKEIAIDSLNTSAVFGLNYLSSVQCWPIVDDLQAKSKEILNQLKFIRVESCVGNTIRSIRFTLSDGSVSPQIGTESFNNSFEFPQNRPIKTIKVRALDDNLVYHLKFCDA